MGVLTILNIAIKNTLQIMNAYLSVYILAKWGQLKVWVHNKVVNIKKYAQHLLYISRYYAIKHKANELF